MKMAALVAQEHELWPDETGQVANNQSDKDTSTSGLFPCSFQDEVWLNME